MTTKGQKRRWTFSRIMMIALTLMLFIVVWSNFRVFWVSKPFISSEISELPQTKTCILLGTSRNLGNGNPNAYFFLRIDACVELYNSGKVNRILISGDNGTKEYNEPEDMKAELIARGIPESVIYLDYAGFDTLDSVVRAKEVFGQNTFIVVSQKFHNQRAVYIARKLGIEAYGYNARDVKKMSGFKTKVREYFACVKAFFEVKFDATPKFLGVRIIIE